MITHKSTCGLCKPGKRFKKNNTKLKQLFSKAFLNEELSVDLIKSYEKLNKFSS